MIVDWVSSRLTVSSRGDGGAVAGVIDGAAPATVKSPATLTIRSSCR